MGVREPGLDSRWLGRLPLRGRRALGFRSKERLRARAYLSIMNEDVRMGGADLFYMSLEEKVLDASLGIRRWGEYEANSRVYSPLVQALGALEFSGNRAFAKSVAPLLMSDDDLVQDGAARALARIGTADSVAPLMANGRSSANRALGMLNVDVSVLGNPCLPRITHHHLGSLTKGLLHLVPDDGMGLGGVGADDEESIYILDLFDGVGHGSGAEGGGESGNRRRVAGGSALVDVVGLPGGAGDLLHQEVLFIGAAAGAQEGDAFRPMLVTDGRKTLTRIPQCLFPGRFPEFAVFPDEGCSEPVRGRYELSSELPFHAGIPVVDH